MGEINVVPYIDVMLVLLIIFMITAPLLKEGVKVDLPTAGGATPMTYQIRPGGKQFVVIAAGGHAKVTEEKQSDAVVAYTLP